MDVPRGRHPAGMPALRPMARPDRRFYASSRAFGRFGIRSFRPQIMPAAHTHGHIELNWLTGGGMDYVYDGRRVGVPAGRLVAFWAGIAHQTVALEPEALAGRQVNVYLPLDTFLHMPQLGRLTETMMGGGIVMLNPDAIGIDTLDRWHADYRSGNALRTDIVHVEIGATFRRAALTGWKSLLDPWIEPADAHSRTASPVRYVVAMVRHICENLSEPLGIEQVAEVVGLHPNYALKLFTSVMHIPIQKFVVRMRLIRARSLLFEGNLSIANIAFQSGFASLSQFYEHFRRAYGITPNQMRRDVIAPLPQADSQPA